MQSIQRTEHDVYPYISATGRLAGAADGKTVMVTGGGKGIGRVCPLYILAKSELPKGLDITDFLKAMTKHFAQAGASKIWITGREMSALEETRDEVRKLVPDCAIYPVTANLVSPSDVTKLFGSLSGEAPDILLNNAGVSLTHKLVAESIPQDWWANFEVNVYGLYLVTRAWLQALDGKPGVVVNTSSSVSDLVSLGYTSYGTSKMAVNRFTEILQLEYGNRGIRALSFHPGGIASTEMGKNAPEHLRHRLIDTVDLAAATALYLTTPDAAYLDGRFVYSNWNMEEVAKLKDDIVKDNLLVSRIDYGPILSPEVPGMPL